MPHVQRLHWGMPCRRWKLCARTHIGLGEDLKNEYSQACRTAQQFWWRGIVSVGENVIRHTT